MPSLAPSALLRQHLREKIVERIDHRELKHAEAAELLGFSLAQVSRLKSDQDIFSLDRLVDAAEGIGLTVRVSATRPYG